MHLTVVLPFLSQQNSVCLVRIQNKKKTAVQEKFIMPKQRKKDISSYYSNPIARHMLALVH